MAERDLFQTEDTSPAVARLYGQPMDALPEDLFIPPEALEIFLETFEGPLDLLLYMIRRQNFNILDIPMAALTAQYLQYVDRIRAIKLELAAEYLLMAAVLVEIKSRMLLPKPNLEADGEPEDPRAELVKKLLQYEQMKRAAQNIDRLPRIGRDFFTPSATVIFSGEKILPTVTAEALQMVLLDMVERAKLTAHHTITPQELSVREHMTSILRQLKHGKFVTFEELFDVTQGVAVIVVHFLALLELTKESLVQITQENSDAPIFVRLAR
jgi:segregation and condensation protein A